jgi:hypothetical protein
VKTNLLIVVSALVSVLVVGGCAIGAVGPGSTQAATPPQIVTDAEKHNVWNTPSAFGPVPSSLQAKGDAICKSAGFKKTATGYHLHAKDLDGKEFVGGGFFCPADDS